MLVEEGARHESDLLFYRVDDGKVFAQRTTVDLVAVVVAAGQG